VVADALRRITGRDQVATMAADWIPDHERRARRRPRRPALVRVPPDLPRLLSIRVLPVEPKMLGKRSTPGGATGPV
jgi:hypothetical protein